MPHIPSSMLQLGLSLISQQWKLNKSATEEILLLWFLYRTQNGPFNTKSLLWLNSFW